MTTTPHHTPRDLRRRWLPIAIVSSCAALTSCVPEMNSTPTTTAVTRRADPQPYHPPATRGPLHSGTTVGLFAAVTEDDVRASAFTFMRAWLAEDLEGLMELMSEEFSLAAGGRTISRRVLREAWQRQFARLDFTQFTVDEVVDRDRIEVIPFDEHRSRQPQGMRRRQHRSLRTGDLLVRLRMRVTRRNRRRYFDDVLELWFRRQGSRWRIVALGD